MWHLSKASAYVLVKELTPKFLETKNWSFVVIQLFLLDKWTKKFTKNLVIPSTSNSDFVWAYSEFLFKTGYKLIFSVFFDELQFAAMWLKLPKGLRAGYWKRSFFFP
jgi:hypothetical protein